MEFEQIALSLILILVVGRIFAELVVKFGAPAVVGEVLAGLILGPSFLGLVELNETLKLLAELGVVLLLFEVGFESDINKLRAEGLNAFIVATFGALIPLFLGFLVSYYIFHLSFFTSLFIGGTLTATSIGISLRVLKDLKLDKTKMAQIIVGAAVLDDILGVIILVALVELIKEGKIEVFHLIKLIFFMLVFLIVAPIFAAILGHILHIFEKNHIKVPGYIPIVVISYILLFSIIAHYSGLPEILGAFVAGIALSGSIDLPKFDNKSMKSFTKRVHHQIEPIVFLFAPIFFVSVGLSIDISEINFSSLYLWILALTLFVVAIIGKMAGAFFTVNQSLKDKIQIGISMIPRGEVGLIFAEFGRSAKVFTTEIYSILIFIVLLTTLLPPFLLKKFK
ncbi:MAG: cation:proton antiporter [Persephonella sp.]|nr:MAG: cation:proton antiporter [Persephonella sp.]RUM62321.1 MAG: cation:proton antiporter [Persephonella sp.]